MIKFRPTYKDEIQLFNHGQFFQLSRDILNTIFFSIDLKLDDLDRAQMVYGVDIPIDFGYFQPDLPTHTMRKIETLR